MLLGADTAVDDTIWLGADTSSLETQRCQTGEGSSREEGRAEEEEEDAVFEEEEEEAGVVAAVAADAAAPDPAPALPAPSACASIPSTHSPPSISATT